MPHQPVLVTEVLEFLNVQSDGNYIDASLGAGGHAAEVLKLLQHGKGRLLGIDRDATALELSRQRLRWNSGDRGSHVTREPHDAEEKLILLQGNFSEIDTLHAASGLPLAAWL